MREVNQENNNLFVPKMPNDLYKVSKLKNKSVYR